METQNADTSGGLTEAQRVIVEGKRQRALALQRAKVVANDRDVHGIHSLITRTSAKERYLLNDVDLDVRTPVLRCIFKRNPHNATWGDMRLYLEAQVAARSLEIWGSEAALEAERARRSTQRENLKLRSFEKKLKTLRMQTRSSLFSKKSEQHEHSFGSETYDEAKDIYFKTCTTCNFVVEFEKL
nr:unnamed protein product [Spirometra erinaceieuropaei]